MVMEPLLRGKSALTISASSLHRTFTTSTLGRRHLRQAHGGRENVDCCAKHESSPLKAIVDTRSKSNILLRNASSSSAFRTANKLRLFAQRQYVTSHRSERECAIQSRLVGYVPPTNGILAVIPRSWVPYAELARIDKVSGSVYLFFPCLFSTLMASICSTTPPATVASTLLLFSAGALVMRGAGCTVNDFWDRNLDPKVERTKLRPLARKALKPQAAIAFAGMQCLAGLAILLQFPQPACLYWGAPSLMLVFLYPLAKRVTHYPQFVLGLTFSWGALMGFPALGVDLALDTPAALAATYLYSSCVSWTVLYDMIYAHMDLKDDRRAGIKSIALKHELNTKQVLAGLSIVQITLLGLSGNALDLGWAFYGISCGGSLGMLWTMIRYVRLKDASNCWWWFRNGAWLTGGTISTGLLVEYLQAQSKEHLED